MPNDDKKNQLREVYVARINRVIDYIEKHIDTDLSLERLSKEAGFSRFHFHRMFGAVVGETLNHFIQRMRLEKAASQLLGNPKKTITEIAFDCGFSGSATFARAFKETFGMSASQFRQARPPKTSNNRKPESKNDQTISKIRQDFEVSSYYVDAETNNTIWRIKMKENQTQVQVKTMPDFNVAYARHVGPYQGDSQLFEGLLAKLMKWAGPRGLLQFPETKVIMVYHDDPNITDPDKLRTSACITVPHGTKVDGEIGQMTIPGGQFAVAHFEITADKFGEAWNMIFGGWMPESGYQPDDGLSYELCHNNPDEHPEKKHIVDICVPVKPL
jgi:AraC family transcriptional regulator